MTDLLEYSNITVESEQFFSEYVFVTITLELSRESTLYSLGIDVFPPVEIFNGSTRVDLMLSYNTPYNVSVVATHPCGRMFVATFVELFYRKCH